MLVLLLLIQLVSAKFSIFDDVFSSPKYSLHYKQISESKISEIIKENNTYEILHDDENRYICEIPIINHNEVNATLNESNLTKYYQIVEDSLSKINKLIYVDHYKFWTYQYKPNNPSLIQYHIPVNYANLLNYTLGDKQHSELSLDYESKSISNTIFNGSYCDLIDDKRSIEIKYICSDESKNIEILSIKEYTTCRYVAQVNIPNLCDIEFFKKYNKINQLSCYKLVDEEQIDDKKINLLEFSKIEKFTTGLFVSESINEFILVNTHSNIDDLHDRLIASVFDLIVRLRHGNTTPNDIVNHIILMNQLLNLKLNVYDSFGNYWTTVHLTIVKNPIFEPTNKESAVTVEIETIDYNHFYKKDSIYFSNYKPDNVEELNQEFIVNNDLKEKMDEVVDAVDAIESDKELVDQLAGESNDEEMKKLKLRKESLVDTKEVNEGESQEEIQKEEPQEVEEIKGESQEVEESQVKETDQQVDQLNHDEL